VPELPEVETVARGLDRALRGRCVRGIELLDPKLQHLDLRQLKGAAIDGARRVGKRVAIVFSTPRGERYLLVHLRMTGVLLYSPNGLLPEDKPAKHIRGRLRLDRGALLFYDPRRFGTLDLVDDLTAAREQGVDPLSRELTASRLAQLIGVSKQPLKLWLLRQDKLAGLGNIYASEILWDCQVSPNRPACGLAAEEAAALVISTKAILRKSIRHAGTTFSDFHNVNGEAGSFLRFLKVYGKTGQPCPRCGAAIQRQVQGQRSTFWCSQCQT
jgi:formamidopyrimidine-DNA glycosylase